jgi:hypothetical protein
MKQREVAQFKDVVEIDTEPINGKVLNFWPRSSRMLRQATPSHIGLLRRNGCRLSVFSSWQNELDRPINSACFAPAPQYFPFLNLGVVFPKPRLVLFRSKEK